MIANEFGEAANDPLHRAALIAAGLVLFVLTLLVNVARARLRRARQRPRAAEPQAAHRRRRATRRMSAASIIAPISPAPPARPTSVARGAARGGTLIALVPLVLVIYYLLKRGLGAISWDFFTTDPTGAFLGDPGRHQVARSSARSRSSRSPR